MRLKSEGGISLKTSKQKRASSRLEGRISRFFSSCGSKVEVPLELQWTPQGPAHGALGNSNLHASCEGPSGFLCSRCQGQNPHLEMRPETLGFSPGPTWISVFLWSFHREVRPRLVRKHACLLSLEMETQCQASYWADIGIDVFLTSCHRAVTTAIMF